MSKVAIATLFLLAACMVPAAVAQTQIASFSTAATQKETGASRTASSTDQRTSAAKPENNQEKAEDKDEVKASGHKTHFRLGIVGVGFSYTHFPNTFFGPFWGYGFYPYAAFYAPFYYDPFYGPYAYPGYLPSLGYALGKGELKLSGAGKDAKVYIDDAYAGTARKLKSMWLEPGAYDIKVQAADGSSFQQRVYVLSGKKLDIRALLVRQKAATEEKK
jgi:hypothetical protein